MKVFIRWVFFQITASFLPSSRARGKSARRADERRLSGYWVLQAVQRLICFFLFYLTVAVVHAVPYRSDSGADVRVDLFISSTCPHCHKVDDFFQNVSAEIPWLHIHRYVINENPSQLQFFYQQLQTFHSNDFSVPTLIFCDSRWVGFVNAETSGKGLLRALNYCHHQLEKEGQLSDVTRHTLRQWSATNLANLHMNINKTTTPPFEKIAMMAWIEALSTCSLFCLLMLLSFIWLYPVSRKAQGCLGGVFILTLGMMHTMQFVFTPLYEQWLSFMGSGTRLAGFVLLLYVMYRLKTRSSSLLLAIPVLLLSLIVLYVQQQCVFSVGAVFQQWMNTQTLTPFVFGLYQALYIGFYLSPLMLLLGFYLVFGVRPHAILFVAACLLLTTIGILLLVYPQGLSSLNLSICALLSALLLGRLHVKLTK